MAVASISRVHPNQVSIPEYQVRLNELQTKVQNLGRRIGTNTNIKFEITNSFDSPSASSFSNVIHIPAWFLIKYDDIPATFRLTDTNDPRLGDSRFINQFANWLNGKFSQMGLSTRCPECIEMQNFVFFVANRETYEKGKDFVLAHEFAHKLYDQNHFFSKHASLFVFFGSLIFGLMIAIAIPFISPAFVTASVIASFASMVFGSCYFLATIRNEFMKEEKFADLQAVNLLGDARGAILYFENVLHFNRIARAYLPPSEKQDYDQQGNFLADKYHPLLTERVKYLRQWQIELLQRLGIAR
jgi:hypothetical protein